MTERLILFNNAMVRAILRGKKTQTRRLFEYVTTPKGFGACLDLSRGGYDHDNNQQAFVCPFGSIGDRLWVRETFARHPKMLTRFFTELMIRGIAQVTRCWPIPMARITL